MTRGICDDCNPPTRGKARTHVLQQGIAQDLVQLAEGGSIVGVTQAEGSKEDTVNGGLLSSAERREALQAVSPPASEVRDLVLSYSSEELGSHCRQRGGQG